MTEITFLVGEGEYESDRTMRPIADLFAREFDARIDYRVPDDLDDIGVFPPSSFGDLSSLDTADLLVVYTRWRQLPDDEMQRIADFCARGGSILGLRTSTHSFAYPGGTKWAAWDDGFGRDILGSPWISHHGHTSTTDVTWADEAGHPILEGVPREFHLASWLYRADLAPGSRPILWGVPVDPENEPEPSPVAWVRDNGPQRIVYTNMGHPDDFEIPAVTTFLVNAARWCLDAPAATGPFEGYLPRGVTKPLAR